MTGIIWGFTGTQKGMTPAQRATVIRLLKSLPVDYAHHGDCIGADDEFDQICDELGIHTIIHPPDNPSKRAWCLRRWIASGAGRRSVVEVEPRPYLERNRAIVDAVRSKGALMAAPHEPTEQLRSGTWSTLRYADKFCVTLRLVLPDGSVTRFM